MNTKVEQKEPMCRPPQNKRVVQGSDVQGSEALAASSEKPADIPQNEWLPNQILRPTLRRFPGIRNREAESEFFVMKDEITKILIQKGLDHFEIFMSHWGYEMNSASSCLEIILHEELKGDVRVELQETFGFWKCQHLKRLVCFTGTLWGDQTRDTKETEKVSQLHGMVH
jgi:hypothetical protein